MSSGSVVASPSCSRLGPIVAQARHTSSSPFLVVWCGCVSCEGSPLVTTKERQALPLSDKVDITRHAERDEKKIGRGCNLDGCQRHIEHDPKEQVDHQEPSPQWSNADSKGEEIMVPNKWTDRKSSRDLAVLGW